MSGLDKKIFLGKEPVHLPSHQHPKLAEVKQGIIGLPHCQPSFFMRCCLPHSMDLDNCLIFEEEIIFDNSADDELGVAIDDILIEGEVFSLQHGD